MPPEVQRGTIPFLPASGTIYQVPHATGGLLSGWHTTPGRNFASPAPPPPAVDQYDEDPISSELSASNGGQILLSNRLTDLFVKMH